MNILFYDMGSFTYKDLQSHLSKAGHQYKLMMYRFQNTYEDAFFSDRFKQELATVSYDVVFSINFFPLIAELCYEIGIPYLSWAYDSPLAERAYSYLDYETNYVCFFDRSEVLRYQAMGHTRVFHLPLAVNTERIDTLLDSAPYPQKYWADVAFIGQLYSSSLDALLAPANDYIKGYVEGIVQSQLRIYGYDFINELIPDDLLEYMNQMPYSPDAPRTRLTRIGMIFAIQKHITHLERVQLFEELGARF